MNRHKEARRTVYEAAPARALQFLLAVNADEAIRRPLREMGFGRAEYERGWRLLRAVAGAFVTDPSRPPARPSVETIARAWYRTRVRCARAALREVDSALARRVFAHVIPSRGDAVASVMRFLVCCEELACDDRGRAALAIFARCGVTRAARAELLAVLQAPPPPQDLACLQMDRTSRLAALHGWLRRWCEIARGCIRRRDLRLRLGIGRRRTAAVGDLRRTPRDGHGSLRTTTGSLERAAHRSSSAYTDVAR